jgi:hypothetical protein
MKQYPSIAHYKDSFIGIPIIAFDKLDGSNLRFEWCKKKGWNKFGTRRTMLDKGDPLHIGVDLFLNKYSEKLERIFADDKDFRGIKEVTIFCELFGPNSFYGQHDFKDMDVVLLDVNPMTKGFIPVREFINKYQHLGIPDIIFDGILTNEMVQDIKSSITLKEGVVCKWMNNKHTQMCKIKTIKWLDELKIKYGQAAIDEEFFKTEQGLNEFNDENTDFRDNDMESQQEYFGKK